MATDWTLAPRLTAIFGMTGSGKTTFALKYLQNTPAAARFIFDDQGQASARLKQPLCGTAAELERSLATRWTLFNPHIHFPGDAAAGFRWFCAWLFSAARRGTGRKMFFADEAWRWCDREQIPQELAQIAQMGRAENLELITATQQPHRLNDSITGSATEMVCFRLQESIALRKIKDLGADPAAVAKLPRGSFISYNRLTERTAAGRLF